MLTGVSLIKQPDGVILDFRRDFTMSLVRNNERRQLAGGKLCYAVLSDGTVSTGHYDRKGKWKFAEPSLINDVFDLRSDEKLWSNSIYANNQRVSILEKTITELDEKFHLFERMESLQESEETEVFIDFNEDGDCNELT